MTKWADFVVSAIKKGSGLANISHVQIHEDLEHGFGSPKLIDKYQLSSKIQKGLTFVTVHKKNENEWAVGELIRTYVKDGEAYIRTDDNKVDGDNLGHMPTVDELDLVFKEIKKEEKVVKKYSLEGKRSLALSWDGYSDLIAGTVEFDEADYKGILNLALPNNDGTCEGSYSLQADGKGTWQISCTNNMGAAGTLKWIKDGGVTGIGRDHNDKKVKFTVSKQS